MTRRTAVLVFLLSICIAAYFVIGRNAFEVGTKREILTGPSSLVPAGLPHPSVGAPRPSLPQAPCAEAPTTYRPHDIEFAFVRATENGQAIFIEVTPIEGPEYLVLVPDVQSNGGSPEVPGKAVEGIKLTKIVNKRTDGLYLNTIDDRYTLLTESGSILLKAEGFYFASIPVASYETVLLKLIPEGEASGGTIPAEPFVVVRRPHPRFETVKLHAFKGGALSKDELAALTGPLPTLFRQYLEKHEPDHSASYFQDTPGIGAYASDVARKKYACVSWEGKKDPMSSVCALFEISDDGGQIRVDPAIPFQSIGHVEVRTMIVLDDRIFVEVEYWGWEHREEAIYEIIPGKKLWQPYLEAAGV